MLITPLMHSQYINHVTEHKLGVKLRRKHLKPFHFYSNEIILEEQV